MDFSKPFDRLDHQILLHKLQLYGVDDPVLEWVGYFFRERYLEVRVRTCLSDPIRVECGVPQSSVPGHRLFLFFINNLARAIASKFLLCADDVNISRTIKRMDDHDILQRDLNGACHWSVRNALPFTVDKCRLVHIRHRYAYLYKVGTHDLQTSPQEFDLGVLVQETSVVPDSQNLLQKAVIKMLASY